MKISGSCYCGKIRYVAEGEPTVRLQCHCRECQYLSGGGPNVTMGMPDSGFSYTCGAPARYRRPDLENGVTREFCAACGPQILSRAPVLPGMVLLKVGTLDEPQAFEPEMAIYLKDRQPFHEVPCGLQEFEELPA